MANGIAVSIVLCTRNRATALRDSLTALAEVDVPPSLPTELLIVDNGSTDDTPRVATAAVLPALCVRILHEPHPGLARARNAGLAAARGRVLLFMDDDVRPPRSWIDAMTRPVLAGVADAVAGGVRLAPHLERPWMEPLHRTWLAETGFLNPAQPQEMVGANMAIGRHVLARVPEFDPELGAGALGQGEESLFSWQLLRVGFRIAGVLDVAVEHHVDERRLLRDSFRAAAVRRGHVLAYQRHHWEHLTVPRVRQRRLGTTLVLAARRIRYVRACTTFEGMPTWEMRTLEHLAFLRRWPTERRRPRHYDALGQRTG